MNVKNKFKDEFSTRLRTALLNAGVGGRGQAGRIRAALKKQGIEVTEAGIWKWLNALSIPDGTNIIALSRWLDVRPEWLQYGQEEYSNLPSSTVSEEWKRGRINTCTLMSDEVAVPFFMDIESAFSEVYKTEDYNGSRLILPETIIIHAHANKDSAICFSTAGVGMEPFISDGSTVAINTNDKKIVDGKIYVIGQNGWYRLRMLYRFGSNRVRIRSYNAAEYPDEEADIDKLKIFGRMFWSSTIW